MPPEIDARAFGQHRLRHAIRVVVEPVAEPADPQHQFGDLGRARVLLQPVELVRPNHRVGFATQRLDRLDHPRFQRLHQLHRHIKEIARPAGRVEHPDGGEAVVERRGEGDGL